MTEGGRWLSSDVLRHLSAASLGIFLLEFAAIVGRDVGDLRPQDMIDLQSFIWVQGSDEYDE